jgi:hypothetical protein
LLVDPLTGDLFIATKEPETFRLYRAPRTSLESGLPITLEFIREGAFALVSAGCISPDGAQVILRREDAARLWVRAAGQSIGDALAGPGSSVPVIGPPDESNGEGITFARWANGYYTISEGAESPIYTFTKRPGPTPTFAASPFLSPGGWRLLIQSCTTQSATLEASTNLIHWNPLATINLKDGVTEYIDSVQVRQRFYRLVPLN